MGLWICPLLCLFLSKWTCPKDILSSLSGRVAMPAFLRAKMQELQQAYKRQEEKQAHLT